MVPKKTKLMVGCAEITCTIHIHEHLKNNGL